MIKLLVPPLKSGGIYDFACKLQNVFGEQEARLEHLSRNNSADWIIDQDDSVVLQFSGYGFENRGAPLWLLHEIGRRRNQIKRFGIYFHELYAFGHPWSSSFWLSPLQRHIARRLAEMSDFWMTSRQGSAHWLERFAGDKPHAVLPVLSTIGEPDVIAEERFPKVIVFGSPRQRHGTYVGGGLKLFDWVKRYGLVIHDIGEPINDPHLLETLRTNGTVLHGRLDEQEIRKIMAGAMFGLLAYPVSYVAKSSIFAAYCAHGLCPVLISEKYNLTDGLEPCKHYLPGVPDTGVIPEILQINKSAYTWYQSHDVTTHVKTIEKLIKN